MKKLTRVQVIPDAETEGIFNIVLDTICGNGLTVYSAKTEKIFEASGLVVILYGNYEDLANTTLQSTMFKLNKLPAEVEYSFVQIEDQNLQADIGTVQIAAADLRDRIAQSSSELKGSRPNDECGNQAFEEIEQFFTEAIAHLDRIILADRKPLGLEVVAREAGALSISINSAVENLLKNPRMQATVDTTLIGSSFAFLAMCGLPTFYAAPTAVAAFAGPKLLENIRWLREVKSNEAQNNDEVSKKGANE